MSLPLNLELPDDVARDLRAVAAHRGTDPGTEVARAIRVVCAGASDDPDGTPLEQLRHLRTAVDGLGMLAKGVMQTMARNVGAWPDEVVHEWDLVSGELASVAVGDDARPLGKAVAQLMAVLLQLRDD